VVRALSGPHVLVDEVELSWAFGDTHTAKDLSVLTAACRATFTAIVGDDSLAYSQKSQQEQNRYRREISILCGRAMRNRHGIRWLNHDREAGSFLAEAKAANLPL
jgi:hypothetical protein